MAEKYEYYTKEAEDALGGMIPEHPDLSQVYMMRGIGFALLAVAHELRVIEQAMGDKKSFPGRGRWK